MSLVDSHPSTLSELKVTGNRLGQDPAKDGAVDRGVGGEHAEHRGHVGSKHPRPLAMPPTTNPSPRDHCRLGPGVGGEDCLGGGRAAVACWPIRPGREERRASARPGAVNRSGRSSTSRPDPDHLPRVRRPGR